MKKRIAAIFLLLCMTVFMAPQMAASGNVYPLTARIEGEGKIISEDAAYEAGDEVEFLLRPASGWKVYSVDIADYFGNYIEWEEHKNGVYSFEMPDNLVAISVVFVRKDAMQEEFASDFFDVPKSSPYYEAVMYVCEKGIFKGVDATVFAPDMVLTRGMMVTLMYRIAGEPDTSKECVFSDVPSDAYYKDALIWAQENEIVTGYPDGTFGADDTLTREQMTAMLWRFAGNPSPVSDDIVVIAVSDYAKDAMKWAASNDMITPSDARAYATRADAAYMIWKYLNKQENTADCMSAVFLYLIPFYFFRVLF